jgi:heptosyltransferase-2
MEPVEHGARVLLARGDNIGDAVLGLGVLRSLADSRPDLHVTLAVRSGLRPLFDGCPWVERIVSFEVLPQMPPRPGAFWMLHTLAAVRRLGLDRFDVAVDLEPRPDPLLGCLPVIAMVDAGRRVAAPTIPCGYEDDVESVYDTIVEVPYGHEVERYAALSSALGARPAGPGFWDLARQRESALARIGRDAAWWSEPKLVVHPGASFAKRRWPAERFAAIAARAAAYDVEVLVVGSAEDSAAAAQVAAAAGRRGVDSAGRLTLLETAALLQGPGLFVGDDSGPMHLAAACGLPCVEISCHPLSGDPWHYNSPLRLGPWGVPAVILQPPAPTPPCGEGCEGGAAHCILQISVDEVWDGLEQLASFDAAPVPSGDRAGLMADHA